MAMNQFKYDKNDPKDKKEYRRFIKYFDGHEAKKLIKESKEYSFLRKLRFLKYLCCVGLVLGIYLFWNYVKYYSIVGYIGFVVAGGCISGILKLTHLEGSTLGYIMGCEEAKELYKSKSRP